MNTQHVILPRYLDLELPRKQSAFLWGARKTGKSTYLKTKFPESAYYNLLKNDVYIRLLKSPQLLREEVLSLDDASYQHPIIIDEIQKVPALLDEVHYLIENSPANFILCGSSARKLKRMDVNLLGGRAWRYEFYPLVYPEIPDFDLLRALNYGLIPSHYLADHWEKSAKAYVNDYLKEEIQAEALVRDLRSFANFLDIAAFSNGELINYTNIASDCGVDNKTVKEYYQILVDTLLGHYLYPYKENKKRKDLTRTPKFYLFDVGITNRLMKRQIAALQGDVAGRLLEHYILMELMAYRGLNNLEFEISFWRVQSGLEVDFILGDGEVAIEVKINDILKKSNLKGLHAFQESYRPKKSIVVNTSPRRRKLTDSGQDIDVYPWREFLEDLWAGKII
ncbi:MAG: AAA family ATPase [Gammaproteobacteria bacterium]|nr:AAA family ATPase [Gammaproteobacteria bacterium]